MAKETTYYKYLLELSTTKKLYDFLETMSKEEKQELLVRLRLSLCNGLRAVKRNRKGKE